MNRGKYQRKEAPTDLVRIGFLIPEQTYQLLRKIAYDENCHMADIARQAIDKDLINRGLINEKTK